MGSFIAPSQLLPLTLRIDGSLGLPDFLFFLYFLYFLFLLLLASSCFYFIYLSSSPGSSVIGQGSE
jgi:hypothetical protein